MTGVQTCDLPICFKEGWEKKLDRAKKVFIAFDTDENEAGLEGALKEIGRASCRERV